tara:strand:- start:934 stop:1377 length:444 start_codon:yes stop_codon:yes gene_type:complete
MFKSRIFLILYTLVVNIAAVFIAFKKKDFLKNYNETMLLVLEALLLFIFIAVFYHVSGHSNTLLNDLKKISKKDAILIIIIPLFFTLTSIVGNQILKHNDISYLTILDTIFDIVLTFLIAYLFFKEKVTTKKVIGILLVLSGIFLVH